MYPPFLSFLNVKTPTPVSSLGSDRIAVLGAYLYRCLHRPWPGLLALASENAYKTKKIKELCPKGSSPTQSQPAQSLDPRWPAGWVVHSFQEDNSPDNTYFGVVFQHELNKQLILSYRGSATPEDWMTDVKLVKQQMDNHFISAYAHGLAVHALARESGYQLGLTGHSLGGGLAIGMLHTIKTYAAYSDELDSTYAVTFDNPGMHELLERAQPTILGQAVSLEHLDITSYLSGAVNPINACGTQVGTVYALIATPETKEFTVANDHMYVPRSHSMPRLLNAFDFKQESLSLGWRCLLAKSWPRLKFSPAVYETSAYKMVFSELRQSTQRIREQLWGLLLPFTTLFKGNLPPSVINIPPESLTDYLQTPDAWNLAHALSATWSWSRVGGQFLRLGGQPLQENSYSRFRELAKSEDGYALTQVEQLGLHENPHESRYALRALFDTKWCPQTEHDTPRLTYTRHIPHKLLLLLEVIDQDLYRKKLWEQPLCRAVLLQRFPVLGQLLNLPTAQDAFLAQYTLNNSPWGGLRYCQLTQNNPLPSTPEYLQYLITQLMEAPLNLEVRGFEAAVLESALREQQFEMLKTLREGFEAERQADWQVLQDLRGFSINARLYLFGFPPSDDYLEQKNQAGQLRQRQARYESYLATFNTDPNVSPIYREALIGLKDRLNYQQTLLKIASALAEALSSLKQRKPNEVIEVLTPLIASETNSTLSNNSNFAHQLTQDKQATVSLRSLQACCYNLLAKAYREKIDPTRSQPELRSKVEQHYLDGLKVCEPQSAEESVLKSSLAAFYDDQSRYEDAKIYHEWAMGIIERFDEGEAMTKSEHIAVVQSNFAYNVYQRADHTQNSIERQRLFRQAQTLLDDSLRRKPNAGTCVYAAQLQFLKAAYSSPKEQEQYFNTAHQYLKAGFQLEPNNLKLKLTQAQYDLEVGNCEQAQYLLDEVIDRAARQQADFPEYGWYVQDAERLMKELQGVRCGL